MSAVPELEAIRQAAEMHAVYRMFDASGRLLYVGMTGDAGTRFGDHAAKRWFPLVETIKLEWHPDKAAARAAERQAIRSERPRYNIAEARPAPRQPAAILALDELGAQVSLAEAVAANLVKGTLAAVRKARLRDAGFPGPVGRLGATLLYDVEELAAWDAGRR